MLENNEIMGGAIIYTPLFLLLCIVSMFHFGWSYYRYAYRRGFKIDFWHATIFQTFILPVIVLYPFAGSVLNFQSTGDSIFQIQQYIAGAFMISISGYASLYAGFYLYNLTSRTSAPFSQIIQLINKNGEILVYNFILNKSALNFYFYSGCLLAGTIFPFFWMKYGINFSLRDLTLGDPASKAIFNFLITSYFPILTTFFGIRYLQYKERIVLAYLVIFLFFSFFSGSRASFLSPATTLLTFYFIGQQSRLKLGKALLLLVIILAAMFFLGDLRSGSFSISGTLLNLGSTFFYGNTFSDLRDFAWVLSEWNGTFLLGKTYLAGLISFLPRAITSFRETWAIGVYTAGIAGFSPEMHPGLRPGPFGEAYLNFGLTGVCLLGISAGYVLRFVDLKIKTIVSQKIQPIYIRAYSCTFVYLLISNFFNTSGFWRFYVLIFILFTGAFVILFIQRLQGKPQG